MFFKSKLIFSMLFTLVLMQPAFAADETNETLMPKGMWKDPATGLIWSRCSLGQTWDGTTCIGEAKKYNWKDAVSIANKTNWQLPTISQLLSIMSCSNGSRPMTKKIPDDKGDSSDIDLICNSNPVIPTIETQIFPSTVSDLYWTVTPYPSRNNDHMRVISFSLGGYGAYRKNGDWYVRLVRANQSLGREEIANIVKSRFTQGATAPATNATVVPKKESCINAKPPFTLEKNEITKFYGECNEKLEVVTGVLVHTNTKENSSDLICYVSGVYTPWYYGSECRKKLSSLPNYCEYENYKGQCANGRANGVGEKFNITHLGIGFATDDESFAGQFTNGSENGYIRRESKEYFKSGRTEFLLYKNGSHIATCAEGSQRIGSCEANYKAETEANNRREAEENRRVAAFRKSVQEGDDTSRGVVVQIKGNLVKIQTNDSQCTQRDYNGNCTNYISTPVEKWFKRSEIYPK